jgi:hypothetical protein
MAAARVRQYRQICISISKTLFETASIDPLRWRDEFAAASVMVDRDQGFDCDNGIE